MSLNRKRRIFRPNASARPARRALPSAGVLLAAVGATATLLFAASFFVRSSEAPARGPLETHVLADAGRLAVVDGDTLRVGEHVVRLSGIIAPARGSVCHGDGPAEVDCGSAAANALALLVRGKAVDCAIQGHDAAGRPVGNCQAAGQGLSDSMVSQGWARAGTADLRGSEQAAKAAGRGIWRDRS